MNDPKTSNQPKAPFDEGLIEKLITIAQRNDLNNAVN